MKTKNYYQGILLHWFSVIYPQKMINLIGLYFTNQIIE